MKNLVCKGLVAACTVSCLTSMVSYAQSDKVVLQTDVIETLLVPESAEALSWERIEPEVLTMPRGIERAGARGCAIFSITIDENGEVDDITTETVVPSFGLRRHAKEYVSSWKWRAKSNGGIEETVLLRLDFCIGGATKEEVRQICLYQATLPCSNKRS
ncbi:energy transducer TonB [Alteromonas flava]|uniref:energy transducer TonB n=1 Tax=Alteromonas flava TaxID=2048003 RepID=UPI000C294FDC|nr:energy transducer TonB [Alteromonas flava]